ncbi:MAG TPA: hypothetical protein VN878_03875 [Usitatibacter sp.]|nr:hypothetical protein [Usitatibacter sp.]
MKPGCMTLKHSRYLSAGRWLLLLLPGGIPIFLLVAWLMGRKHAPLNGD